MIVRTLRLRLGAAAGVALALSLLAAPLEAAEGNDDRVAELIERAAIQRDRGDHRKAAKLFAEADRAAGGRSIHALAGLCQASLALGRSDDAVAAAERWIALAESPQVRAGGHHYLGVALRWRGMEELRAAWEQVRKADADAGAAPTWRTTLERAAEELRAAAAAVPENRHVTLLHLADVLVQLDEYREATEVLDQYAAAAQVEDPLAEELRCWSERALEDHEAVASAGEGELTPPSKLHSPAPQYTQRARQLGVSGRVILRAIIDRAGRVDCVQILSGIEPSLDRSALSTVMRWRFEPAMLDGKAVEVTYNLNIEFSLQRRPG